MAKVSKNVFLPTSIALIFFLLPIPKTSAAPKTDDKTPRQLFDIERNPDGGITGSYSFANAVDLPGVSNSLANAGSFSIGPQGASLANSMSYAMDSGIPGLRSGFSGANANAFSVGSGGASSANANAASFGIGGPNFSKSFSNANANSFSTGGGGHGRHHHNRPSSYLFR